MSESSGEQERRKPSDVAWAESEAYRLGLEVARDMKRTFLIQRHTLLEAGWPSGHALCEELDREAEKWTAIEARMRQDYHQHAKQNHIQL